MLKHEKGSLDGAMYFLDLGNLPGNPIQIPIGWMACICPSIFVEAAALRRMIVELAFSDLFEAPRHVQRVLGFSAPTGNHSQFARMLN